MALLDVLAFLTRFPVGPRSWEGVGRSMHLFPVVGALVGTLLALAAYGLGLAGLPSTIAAALLLALLYGLTGVLHFDGLVDLADAAARGGGPEERRKALRDPAVGAAGLLAGVLLLLVLWAAVAHAVLWAAAAGAVGSPAAPIFLPSLPALLAFFVSAEAGAKHAMVAAATIGRPLEAGSGRTFLGEATRGRFLTSLALASTLAFGPWGWAVGFTPGGLLPVAALLLVAHAVPVVAVGSAHRTVGGVNGDVLGAVNETTRAALLVLGPLLLR